MKIVFFGTSDYVLPVLETLLKNFDLRLVVTRPDKPVGRKQILTPSAVKTWAQKNNLAFATPATMKKETLDRANLLDIFKDIQPDLSVVADYGLIIPEEIFNFPKLGTLNIHFSLLPDLRGPSPIQTALLRGNKITGITVFKLESPKELKIKMDAGPIVWQKEYPISENDTAETLYSRLFQEAAKELPGILRDYSLHPNQYPLIFQDHSKATYTKMLSREDGFVPWPQLLNSKDSLTVYNRFRAMFPWPGLWSLRPAQDKPQRMKILKCHLKENELILDEVQFEGKKPQRFIP